MRHPERRDSRVRIPEVDGSGRQRNHHAVIARIGDRSYVLELFGHDGMGKDLAESVVSEMNRPRKIKDPEQILGEARTEEITEGTLYTAMPESLRESGIVPERSLYVVTRIHGVTDDLKHSPKVETE
jgi:hypothetical protein